MNEIGKSLVFYLTYFPEMVDFPDKRKPIDGIDRKQVQRVKDRACVEARCLLRACIDDCIANLNSAKVARINGWPRDSTIENKWDLGLSLWRPGQRFGSSVQRQIGIYISEDAELIPWLWSRGGVAAEAHIQALLTSGVKWTPSVGQGIG